MTRVGEQVAALPLMQCEAHGLRVLMVTSRGTGRWVLPKGWAEAGMTPWEAAAMEALEEAGAEGPIAPKTIGAYTYGKVLDNGSIMPCRVQVYPLVVQTLHDDWKERTERSRDWFPPTEAADLVHEPELAALFRDISRSGGLGAMVPFG